LPSSVTNILEMCPRPPDWSLDWDNLNLEFDWIRGMKGVLQDPIHHAEGDVWIHTRMVCEALVNSEEWRTLPEEERAIPFLACLLHDVAKPVCTRYEDGRITSRGHSSRGEIMARSILWSMGLPIKIREHVVALVRYHQIPFFLIDQPDSEKRVFSISQILRCDYLAMVTEADARGRICKDLQRLLDNIMLFVDYSRENGCLTVPKTFPTEHSRFLYFQKENRDPTYMAYDDTNCEVVLMSGLPGSGKDYWIAEHLADWPIVSLDGIREEMGISPKDNQGRVVTIARERAREYLRRKQSFVWNATNISRRIRKQCIDLFAAYNAKVRIVYVETSEEELYRQNRERPNEVPTEVIRRLLERWEVPDIREAHRVEWVVDDEVV
jgi:predicted kinase